MNLNFLKNKRILTFLSIAVVISILLIVIIINSIEFMDETVKGTSNFGEGKTTPAIRFNFDKLREIGIIKD